MITNKNYPGRSLCWPKSFVLDNSDNYSCIKAIKQNSEIKPENQIKSLDSTLNIIVKNKKMKYDEQVYICKHRLS